MTTRKTAATTAPDAGQLAGNLARLAPAPEPKAPKAMPAEQDRPEAFPRRLPVQISEDMRRDLLQAKTDDDTEVSARIRAMITLWQTDDRFRARVDKLAKTTGRPPQDRGK